MTGPVGEPADAPPSEVNVRRAESADDLALVERILIDGYRRVRQIRTFVWQSPDIRPKNARQQGGR